MRIKTLFAMMSLMAVSLTVSAQKVMDADLYQGRPSVKSEDSSDTAKVRIFLPSEKENTGRAVVICPGGGYTHLAMDHEGYQWGEFFQNQGITAVVLKYRMPHGNPDVPVADAEQAMKLVRMNAQAWHINLNEVGIMGFSAGGHLASTIATQSKGDARPDFQILFYPVISMMDGLGHQGSHDNFLGKKVKKKVEQKYSSDMHVTRTTPRALILLSDDDTVVPPANGVNYYMELYKNDVPGSLHVYPGGGHGWGSRIGFRYHEEMMMDLKAWFRSF